VALADHRARYRPGALALKSLCAVRHASGARHLQSVKSAKGVVFAEPISHAIDRPDQQVD
jgi:hypothetical protein